MLNVNGKLHYHSISYIRSQTEPQNWIAAQIKFGILQDFFVEVKLFIVLCYAKLVTLMTLHRQEKILKFKT